MITVITPPAGEPVSPAELKARLRVTHDLEDDLLQALLIAARERLEAELGVRLVETGLREVFAPRRPVVLSVGPVTGVDAVCGSDGAGGWTPLDPASWTLQGDRPGRIRTPAGDALRVDYRAGFATDPAGAPAPLKEAVLALAAEAFERRADPLTPAPPGLGAAERWAAPFRRMRL